MRASSMAGLYGIFLTTLAVSVVGSGRHRVFHQHPEVARRTTTTPMVFAHYMISFQPPGLNYTPDINMAQAAGINAFAVNYGGYGLLLPYFQSYLDIMYKTAEKLNFKLFLCIDTTSITSAPMVVNLTNFYADSPAQAKDSHGNILLSSFKTAPPPWNWQTDVIDQIKRPVTFLPGTLSQDASYTESLNQGFGPFTWIHPACNATGEGHIDNLFTDTRNSSGAPWMAWVAPWFFKRLGPDMNWLHAQDSYMWIDRWMNLLKLKPNYIEIITWNDFGESSYIGPSDPTPAATLANPSTPDYYGNLDHSAFLKMASIFIKAFKAGEEQVTVDPSEENIFMFYRIPPALVNGYSDSLPLPENVSSIEDNVYVVPFLASDATVKLDSGGKPWQMDAPAGVSKGMMAFSWGNQTLTASRPINGATLNKQGPAIVGQLSRYQGNVVAI